MKKKRYVVIAFLLILIAVLLARTALFSSQQLRVTPAKLASVQTDAAASRLAGALRFQTISTQDATAQHAEEFIGLRKYLEAQYPAVHGRLQRETVENYSLLYTWKGSDPGLDPVLVMAHLDVVPAESEKSWQQPPFAGNIAGGFVWGRGALDDKASAVEIFEAVESLLQAGFAPKRTVYLAFGHNEEVLGSGAAAIAALLQSRRVHLESVLDEGSVMIGGMIPGLDKNVALIGTAEKGYMSVRLTVRTEGGHSSMPPRYTAVGVLSKAIVQLEKRRVPASLEDPVEQMFQFLGPEMPFAGRVVFSNLWLFGPLVRQVLAGSPSTNAMIRTTTAPTMFEGSQKENVLPTVATAVVNFRILPGDTTDEILAHVMNTVRDESVNIEALNRSEASPISPSSSETFRLLQRTICEVFPGTLVAPALVVGATDSRSYVKLTRNIYRFLPVLLHHEDLDRIHGENERIGVDAHARAIQFYVQYLMNSARR